LISPLLSGTGDIAYDPSRHAADELEVSGHGDMGTEEFLLETPVFGRRVVGIEIEQSNTTKR